MPGIDYYTAADFHFDGANNSTSPVVNDSTSAITTISLAGNAKLTTATKKFGTASISLDGSAGTYAGTPWDSTIFPSGDFTIDFWANFNATTSGQTAFSATDITAVGFGAYLGISLSSASFNFFSASSNSAWDIANSQFWGTISSGVWSHWAVTRQSSIFRLFKDGLLGTTFTSTLTPYHSSTNEPFLVGAQGYNGAGNTVNFMNGFVDEYRFSNGIARWTANFTPPVVPYDQWEPGWDVKSDDWRRTRARMLGY